MGNGETADRQADCRVTKSWELQTLETGREKERGGGGCRRTDCKKERE